MSTQKEGTPKTEKTERVRATRLRPRDRILVQFDKVRGRWLGQDEGWETVERLFLSGTKPPRRAFWAVVASLERRPGGSGLLALILDIDGARMRIAAKQEGLGIGDWAVTRQSN